MNYTYKNKPNTKTRLFSTNITPITEIKNQMKIKQTFYNNKQPDKIFDTETFDKIYKEELGNGFIKEYI